MASDQYGRDGYDDPGDNTNSRYRSFDQESGPRAEPGAFGPTNYPDHDYWGESGQGDGRSSPEPQTPDFWGGNGRRRAAHSREDVPSAGDGREGNGRSSYGRDGYGRDGYGRDGYGRDGYGRDGYGRDGYGRDGYGRDGYGRDGYGRDGYGRDGYGRDGDRRDGYVRQEPGRDLRRRDSGQGYPRRDDEHGWNDGTGWTGTERGHATWEREPEPPILRDRAFEGDRGAVPTRARRYAADYDEDDSVTSWRSKARRKRKNMPLWQELPLLLIVAFCLAVLIRTFLVQAFYIPSGSMEETLLVGDRVLVNKILYDVREPERGEVVVFEGPANWAPENQVDKDVGFFSQLGRTVGDLVGFSQPGEKDFIKRVIGLPGDIVACCDVQGRVTVNGYPLDESSYIYEDSPLDATPNPKQCTARRFNPVKVEPGQMFVMGDHRGVSQDSRCQGQVPVANVIGRAFVVLWPSSRWGWLTVPDTFKNVPKNAAGPAPGPWVTRVPNTPLVPDMLVAPMAVTFAVSRRSARQGRLGDREP